MDKASALRWRVDNLDATGRVSAQVRAGTNEDKMSSTVKQEHRNNARLARDAKAINDYLGQREAMRLVRKDRPALAPLVSDIATRSQIAAWMMRNVADYENETALVEGANCALKLPVGCMDDETHWVWDVAVNITDRANMLA